MCDCDNGIGNRLELDEEDILENLQEIQLGLSQTKILRVGSYDFDVKMETGERDGCNFIVVSRISGTLFKIVHKKNIKRT